MIQVEQVNKSFKVARRRSGIAASLKALFHRKTETVQALNNLSFHIQKGEIVGYIGTNGAGKSTSIKILSGILTPDSGTVLVNGKVPWLARKEYVKDIGVVFGQRSQLWWDVPVMDSFDMLCELYGIDRKIYAERVAELSSMLHLEGLLNVPARQLSLGQRMRCELAASLLHQPSVLFLDEPTIGLDALSKLAVRDFIRQLNEKYQTTVILTTHDMQDIEALCQRVLLIGKGRLLYDGTLEALKHLYGSEKKLTLLSKEKIEAPNGLTLNTQALTDKGWLSEGSCKEAALSSVLRELTQRYEIIDCTMREKSIEEVVALLYRELELAG